VPATKRSGDPKTDQRNHKPNFPARRPARAPRHEPAHAEPQDAAELKENNQNLEERTAIEWGSDHLQAPSLVPVRNEET